jgi:hypothetical protein
MAINLEEIIEKKLDLFLRPSFSDYGFKSSELIKPLMPDDIKRIRSSFDNFISLTAETINQHSSEAIRIIKSSIIESGAVVTDPFVLKIVKISNSKIFTSKYLEKLPNFIGSIKRHYARMGCDFEKSKFRLDLVNARYEALVKNLVRSHDEKLKSELDLLLLSSQKITQSEKFEKITFGDANKAIDLKPNIFGVNEHAYRATL